MLQMRQDLALALRKALTGEVKQGFCVLKSVLIRVALGLLINGRLASGEAPRNDNIPVAEYAGWSQVAALLLNVSEAVTRN